MMVKTTTVAGSAADMWESKYLFAPVVVLIHVIVKC
jgi:hypothetical protein